MIDSGDGTRGRGAASPASRGGFRRRRQPRVRAGRELHRDVTVDDFTGSELTLQALVNVAPAATATSLACSPGAGHGLGRHRVHRRRSGPRRRWRPPRPTGLVTFSTATPGRRSPRGSGARSGRPRSPACPCATSGSSPDSCLQAQARVARRVRRRRRARSERVDSDGRRPGATLLAAGADAPARARPGWASLVTCDAQSGVEVAVKARVARRAKFPAFSLTYGTLHSSVTAGARPCSWSSPRTACSKALRDTLRHHQRVSLRVTLTASARSTQRRPPRRGSRRSGSPDASHDRLGRSGRRPRAARSAGTSRLRPARSGRCRAQRSAQARPEQCRLSRWWSAVDGQLAERVPVVDLAPELLVHLAPRRLERELAAPDPATGQVPVAATVGVAHSSTSSPCVTTHLTPHDLGPAHEVSTCAARRRRTASRRVGPAARMA